VTRQAHIHKPRPANPYRVSGVRPGDRLRLDRAFVVRDHKGRLTGKRHCPGELWTVLHDSCQDHDVIWLAEPDGSIHTWDGSLLKTFSIVARAPTKGTRVLLRRLPPWVRSLPQESKEAIRYCLHHSVRVQGVDDHGLIELVLGRAADRRLGGFMNSINIEAEFLTTTPSSAKRPNTALQGTRSKRRSAEP